MLYYNEYIYIYQSWFISFYIYFSSVNAAPHANLLWLQLQDSRHSFLSTGSLLVSPSHDRNQLAYKGWNRIVVKIISMIYMIFGDDDDDDDDDGASWWQRRPDRPKRRSSRIFWPSMALWYASSDGTRLPGTWTCLRWQGVGKIMSIAIGPKPEIPWPQYWHS